MAHRNDITNTILAACKAIAPSVNWGFTLTGAKKSNLIEGTISCNEVSFDGIAKDKLHAKAQYDIAIIELDGTVDIDAIADDIFNCFKDTNMGGLCYSVDVKRIVYGAIQGVTASTVVKLELEVAYPVS